MAINDSPEERFTSIEKSKKPYEKPAFSFEEVFVTTALACTKQPTVCHGNPVKNS